MKKNIFTVIISLLIFSCSSTKEIDRCSKNLDNELSYFKTKNKIEFKKDYEILEKCAKLDSIDRIIFSSEMIGVLSVDIISENKKITYRNLINKIKEIKENDKYSKGRELVYLSEKIKTKVISKDEWNKDKIILQKLGMKGDYLNKFKMFISKFENTNTNYEIAMTEFKSVMDKKTEPFKFRRFINYEKSIASSISENKFLLLFFSAHSGVNCNRMEKNILIDKKINSILNKYFTSYILYVDSREKLKEKYISKKTGREINTIGKVISELQMEKFNSNRQPYFVILDNKGNIIKEQGYTNDVNEFKEFITMKRSKTGGNNVQKQ